MDDRIETQAVYALLIFADAAAACATQLTLRPCAHI